MNYCYYIAKSLAKIKRTKVSEVGDLVAGERIIAFPTNLPVIIGKDFWYRLTGQEDFYFKLIDVFSDVAIEIDGTQVIAETIESLKNEILEKGI